MRIRTLLLTIIVTLALSLLGSVVLPALTSASSTTRTTHTSNLPTPPATSSVPTPFPTTATTTTPPTPLPTPTATAQPTPTTFPTPTSQPTPVPSSTPSVPPCPAMSPTPHIVAWDDFHRSDQNTWNVVTSNPADHNWNQDPASSFSIKNQTGIITETSQRYMTATLGGNFDDPTATVKVVFSTKFTFSPSSVVPNAQNFNIGAIVRYRDDKHYYKAYIDGQSLVIIKKDGAQTQTLATTPFSAQPGLSYILRFCVSGSQLSATAWRSIDVITPELGETLVTNDSALQTGSNGLRFLAYPGAVVSIFSFGLWAL